ncbi:MAG: hypothetical protein OK457_09755 [Thaumarchaeota archaeon]|nr:hypothetical protein [Nitrososphaerota archaeon]
MDAVDLANLATSIALISTSIVLITLVLRMGEPKEPSVRRGVQVTRLSTLLLAVFLLVHGFYHVAEYFGNDFLSDGILNPVSILFLLAFTIYVKLYIFVPKAPKKVGAIAPKPSGASPAMQNRTLVLAPATLIVVFSILTDFAGNIPETLSLAGMIISVALFSWMAIKNPSVQSLHFEFAIIVLIWAAAEIPHGLSTLGILSLGGIDVYGTWVHFLSMLLIGIFICLRTFRLAIFAKQGMIEPQLKT